LMKDIDTPITGAKSSMNLATVTNSPNVPGKVSRVTATTNELDALVQDLVDSSKKARTTNQGDALSEIMNDLSNSNLGSQNNLQGNIGGGVNNNRISAIIQPSRSAGQELDNIGGGMNKPQSTAINTVEGPAKGVCDSCQKNIVGDIIQALNKHYHPEHFNCCTCSAVLGVGNFYEKEGQPQCERCYYSNSSEQCTACGLPITTQVLNALNQIWHPSCFVCTNCLQPFTDGKFFERDSRPFCSVCFGDVFAPRCKSCGSTISGSCVNAMGAQWHAEHFVCQYCKKPFPKGLFFEVGGLPYCEAHYQLSQRR